MTNREIYECYLKCFVLGICRQDIANAAFAHAPKLDRRYVQVLGYTDGVAGNLKPINEVVALVNQLDKDAK